jgi:hypothetical protein
MIDFLRARRLSSFAAGHFLMAPMIRSSIRVLLLASVLAVGGTAMAGEPPPLAPTACKGAEGHAAGFEGRRTFRWRAEWLMAGKARLTDPAIAPAYKALIKRADAALAGPTYTVTDKSRTPPSGDKHDYISMGPYWWPDPSKPNGEPYVRRDGQFNPERATNAFDVTDLDAMSAGVEALSLAYYFTGDRRYADKAAQLLKVWFLDPATRMNPNAKFAQGVPGRTLGRAEGVLDTYRLLRVVEGVGLLGPSGALSAANQAGLERWFAEYAQWMRTSPTGQEERAALNNHGVWFDYQLATFALFSRDEALARDVIAKAGDLRIAMQITPEGALPKELERTRALHYSYFAIEPLVGLAELGRCTGQDLWRYQSADGRSLRKAFDFLGPYVGREDSFPYKELEPKGAAGEAAPLFGLAAWAYGDASLAATAAVSAKARPDSLDALLIAPYGR